MKNLRGFREITKVMRTAANARLRGNSDLSDPMVIISVKVQVKYAGYVMQAYTSTIVLAYS